MNIADILNKLNTVMNDYELSRELSIPQPTLYRLRKAQHNSCSFDRGMKILELARSKGLISTDCE